MSGRFWHAVMHRREPDAWNSKYWWRQVGDHPAFRHLTAEAVKHGYVAGDRWTPAAFVDACEAARGTKSDRETALRRVQLAEWRLLFDWCYRKAVGES